MDLLVVFDADGRLLQVNGSRWRELLGWHERDLVGAHYSAFLHPNDVARTDEVVRRGISEGEPAHGFANRYRTRTGGYRWLLWETRQLDDGRWLAAARDITGERETLEELDALRRVATQVASGASPEALFAAVAEEVGRLMAADAAGVTKRLGEQRLQIAGVWVRDRAPSFRPGQVLELPGASLLERFRQGGLIRHREREAERDTVAGLRRYGSSVTVPISVDGAQWGRISAFYVDRDAAREDSQPRLAKFAELTAMAVANADARQQLEQRALTDALTGLMNHGAFRERIAAEVARAYRHERPLTVALLDVDRFKQINDRFGHHAGDHVLREFGRCIRDGQRLGDVVGRIGGDEFAVAFPDTRTAGAVTAIERLREDLTARSIKPAITISAGVAELGIADTVDTILRRADEQLYASKRQGGARTSTASC